MTSEDRRETAERPDLEQVLTDPKFAADVLLAERIDGFVGWHVHKREPRYRFARRFLPIHLSLALVGTALLANYVAQFARYRSLNQTAP